MDEGWQKKNGGNYVFYFAYQENQIFRENAEVNVYCSLTVSREFRGLQMILMDRTKVPGVPLDVTSIFFLFMFL